MAGWLNWSVTILAATACTVATSALFLYTANYLLRDHHSTLKKNKFKRSIKTIIKKLNIIEQEIIKNEGLLRDLKKQDMPNLEFETETESQGSSDYIKPKKDQQVLYLNECFTRLLIELDQIDLSQIKGELVGGGDKDGLIFAEKHSERVARMKRDLIEKIHRKCKILDTFAF
jgi:hypothetical protein